MCIQIFAEKGLMVLILSHTKVAINTSSMLIIEKITQAFQDLMCNKNPMMKIFECLFLVEGIDNSVP